MNSQHGREPQNLTDLGWRAFFADQLNEADLDTCVPARVTSVHRDAMIVHDGESEHRIHLGRRWKGTQSEERPTTGDWVLLDPERGWMTRLLRRETVLKRLASGLHYGQQTEEQAIAANIDLLFVLTSCNEEFSESRLERYLVVAQAAGIQPVVVLTKSDLAAAPKKFRQRAKALTVMPVVSINATDPSSLEALDRWIKPGRTIAMVGSSGVGKSTLLNSLAGRELQFTRAIREVDTRGRHTTTVRSIHLLASGAILLDTPGIRELAFAHGEESLLDMYRDVEELIALCRFSDCRHDSEPGCAIKKAIEDGDLDERRLENYRKLTSEQPRNNARLAEQHVAGRRHRRQKAAVTETGGSEEPAIRHHKKKRKRRV